MLPNHVTDAPSEPASGVMPPRLLRRSGAALQREMNRQLRVWTPRRIAGQASFESTCLDSTTHT